jgi:hypothetical protein
VGGGVGVGFALPNGLWCVGERVNAGVTVVVGIASEEELDRLAELPLKELTYRTERGLQGTDKWVDNGCWKSCMEGASKARLGNLVDQLGLKIIG